MAAFVQPGDNPADVNNRLGCVMEWLTEAVPAWAARLEHEPATDEAVAGLCAILHEVARTEFELARNAAIR